MEIDTPLRRRSIRLKGYDYSKAGAYFITICVKDKIHFFGKIENGIMILNDAGIMIDKWWQKISEKFPDIELGDYQIMPNHFHAIVINTGMGNIVRADPCVRPETDKSDSNETFDSNESLDSNKTLDSNDTLNLNIGQTHGFTPTNADNTETLLGEHTGSPLRAILQWFKTMSSNEYIHGVKKLGWRPFYGKLWQRNYYEHIIRDEKSYNAIVNYIKNNPANWENDNFYLK